MNEKLPALAILAPRDIIAPFFVIAGDDREEPIAAMPGVSRLTIDRLLREVAALPWLKAVLLFGLAEGKNESGTEAYAADGIIPQAIRALRKTFTSRPLKIMTDVCLCGYTSHGHCRILKDPGGPQLVPDDDASREALVKIALAHAAAGADVVAPSAMLPGQVAAIHAALREAGCADTGIMGYSAKFASHFYGPFREALRSAPSFGDRTSYQLDFREADTALRKITDDINAGADIVMVKPALAYMDIIARAKQIATVPLATYNVSGEYRLLKHGLQQDGAAGQAMILEVLTSLKRAGADYLITYFAKDLGEWLNW